jgi:hypothetical protein
MTGNCVICHKPLGNSVVCYSDGCAHDLCHYRRESERPRDEVITELRARLTRAVRELRQQHPCAICRWPRPADNEHNICECCGFQEGYDRPEYYEWDGQWWAKDIDRAPLIVERYEAALKLITSSEQLGGAWCAMTAAAALIRKLRKVPLADDAVDPQVANSGTPSTRE